MSSQNQKLLEEIKQMEERRRLLTANTGMLGLPFLSGTGVGGAAPAGIGSGIPPGFTLVPLAQNNQLSPAFATSYGSLTASYPGGMSSTQQPQAVTLVTKEEADKLKAEIDAVATNAKLAVVAVAATAKHAARVAEDVAEKSGVTFKRPAINMDSNWLKGLNMKAGSKKLKVIDNGPAFKPITEEGEQAYAEVMEMFAGDDSVNHDQVEILAREAAKEADDRAAAGAAAGAAGGSAGGNASGNAEAAHLELFKKNTWLADPAMRLELVNALHNNPTGAKLRALQKQYTDNSKTFGFGFCAWATDPFTAPDPATIAAWRAYKADNGFPAADDWNGA